ncbi:hypothetical protein DFH09DRAFT_1150316 [Mycena vulgaris]|nr:hypothetical protein DFH09DRAFT_1150316 [Mycena vulgaris]
MDSALVSPLQHNDPPTEAEVCQLRPSLDAGEAELSQLTQTATTLELLLSEIRTQYSRRSESLMPLRGALSALRRFPAEILGEIFMLYTEHTCTSSGARHASDILLLGHVCARWRVVSHGFPRLWDNLVFSPISTASVVRDILARSRNLPLSLSVIHFGWRKQISWDFFLMNRNTLLLKTLWDSHGRVEHLTLDLGPKQVAWLTPKIFAQHTPFPALASLSISSIVGPGNDPEIADFAKTVLDGFRQAPVLHSLNISCEPLYQTPPARCVFPWSQLRNLRMRMSMTLLDARNILTQCQQLESARFSIGSAIEDPDTGIPGMPPTCTLTRLQELYLAVDDDVPSEDFFEAFTFPNLERLAMDVAHWSTAAFRRFYTRSNFKLWHLHLERIDDMTADDVLEFIRFVPTLHTLRIINCRACREDALFEIFTHSRAASQRSVSLPALTKLVLELTFDIDGTAVADMAESLFVHRGHDSPFPVLELLYLTTHSCEPDALYGAEVEARLAAVAATGFLVRQPSPDPDDITAYTKEDGNQWTWM